MHLFNYQPIGWNFRQEVLLKKLGRYFLKDADVIITDFDKVDDLKNSTPGAFLSFVPKWSLFEKHQQKTFLFALGVQAASQEDLDFVAKKFPQVAELLIFDPHWALSVTGRALFRLFVAKQVQNEKATHPSSTLLGEESLPQSVDNLIYLEGQPIFHPAKVFSQLLGLWFCSVGGLDIEVYTGQAASSPTYFDKIS